MAGSRRSAAPGRSDREDLLKVEIVTADPSVRGTPLLVVPTLEGEQDLLAPVKKIDRALNGLIADVLGRGDFKGREGQTQVLYPPGGSPAERLLLVGLGKREKLDAERLRRAAGTAVKQAVRLGVDRASTVLHCAADAVDRLTLAGAARAIAEGAELGSFVFDEYKRREAEDPEPGRLQSLELLEPVEANAHDARAAAHIGGIMARAENFARRLGNLPGNVATPTYLAESAKEIAGRFGMKLTVLGRAEMEKEGMGALLAVAQGSEEEPRLIVLEHRKGKAGTRPLVLVGKGITFDSGGISIKPAQSMEEMKFDMCGAAAVLAAMQAIGELEVPGDVVAIVPSSENLLSGKAMKPGDILRSHLGKTIEVVNTDAEGRLILADALSFAQRFEPAAIVDAATLTGACVVALGHQASAVLGNDDGLVRELQEVGGRVGQRVWPLPMFDEYREQIKSEYADIKNSGGRPAGTITAAWFLREFVGNTPWAHLDIAGTAYGEGKLPYQTKGATGVPTRLLAEWVLSRVG